MSDRLKGKRAFVTAGAAGIGRASAIAFAREGAHVFATDIDEKSLAALAKEGVAEVAKLDARDTAAVNAMAKRVGKVDILLAVYADWIADEHKDLASAADSREAARVLLRHHRATLKFRRMMRSLAVTEERVRAARARSRLFHIAYLRKNLPHAADMSDADLARSLLVLERVADACAEGQFAELSILPEDAEAHLSACLDREFGPPPQAA